MLGEGSDDRVIGNDHATHLLKNEKKGIEWGSILLKDSLYSPSEVPSTCALLVLRAKQQTYAECKAANGVVEAQWPIGYGVGLRIKRSSVRIRPWPLR